VLRGDALAAVGCGFATRRGAADVRVEGGTKPDPGTMEVTRWFDSLIPSS
jgi:hypothetical protein